MDAGYGGAVVRARIARVSRLGGAWPRCNDRREWPPWECATSGQRMPSSRPGSVVLSAVVSAAALATATVAAKTRPHILMILADDCEAQHPTRAQPFDACPAC